MRRREFITLLGGAAAWSLAARAQPAAGTLRLGTVAFVPRSAPIWVAFDQRLAGSAFRFPCPLQRAGSARGKVDDLVAIIDRNMAGDDGRIRANAPAASVSRGGMDSVRNGVYVVWVVRV